MPAARIMRTPKPRSITPLTVGRRVVGEGYPCLIIAEVAQAHDGSLGTAHAFVDAIADAGADAVKFQTHIASAESTPLEQFRVHFSVQDRTRYDYWKRTEFTQQQWAGLMEHAESRGLLFISSPFSVEAVQLLARIGMPAWKVASGELSTTPMFDAMLATSLPFIVSSGMSNYAELDDAVARLTSAGARLAVLQCTTAYPCPPERIGLNVMSDMRERYGVPVGLSDHSGTIYPGLAAVTLGASIVETHFTLSRQMFGPDVRASLTPTEFAQLVQGIRFIERMEANPVDKDVLAAEMEPLRRLFTKSIVAGRPISRGQRISAEDLACKKPGTGMAPARLPELIGRTAKRDLERDKLIEENDLE